MRIFSLIYSSFRKEPARLGPVEHLEAILGTSALHSEYYSEPGANADPSDSGGGPVDDPETMATQNDPTDSESQANQSAATADSGVSEGDAIHREKPITDDDPTDQQFSAEDNIATAGNPEATLTNESDPEILTERKWGTPCVFSKTLLDPRPFPTQSMYISINNAQRMNPRYQHSNHIHSTHQAKPWWTAQRCLCPAPRAAPAPAPSRGHRTTWTSP